MMTLEWRIGDNVEIAVGRSRVECALPARIGYMGGRGDPEKGYRPWFEVWFGVLVWYINIEYDGGGINLDDEWGDDV